MKGLSGAVKSIGGALGVMWLVAACSSPIAPVSTPNATLSLIEQAAQEATLIVQRAEATALVARARATANALVAVEPTATVPAPTVEPAKPIGTASVPTAPAPRPTAAPAGEIKILGVSFGAQGNYIHVQFLAPVKTAQNWQQGLMSVTDEATGTVFGEVPVMPVVGPLLSRPVRDGQPGYVMLVHNPMILKPGSMVTVKLGGFVQEHVEVGQ